MNFSGSECGFCFQGMDELKALLTPMFVEVMDQRVSYLGIDWSAIHYGMDSIFTVFENHI